MQNTMYVIKIPHPEFPPSAAQPVLFLFSTHAELTRLFTPFIHPTFLQSSVLGLVLQY